MTRHLTTLLLVGCWLLAMGSSVTLAAPVLTIQAPAHCMIQDSTNLVDWQDVIVTRELTVLATPGLGFLRGRVTETTQTLTFDRNPLAAGTFIYLGAKSNDYFQRFDAGTNATLTLTIIQPTPDLYFAATSYFAANESDFSNEIRIPVPAPLLTVTVSQ